MQFKGPDPFHFDCYSGKYKYCNRVWCYEYKGGRKQTVYFHRYILYEFQWVHTRRAHASTSSTSTTQAVPSIERTLWHAIRVWVINRLGLAFSAGELFLCDKSRPHAAFVCKGPIPRNKCHLPARQPRASRELATMPHNDLLLPVWT